MEENQGPDDLFDRLSDELVTFIFNKLQDAKSLCSCSAVSKRFASLVPQTDHVSIVIPSSNASKPKRGTWFINSLKYLLRKFITKPLVRSSDEEQADRFTAKVARNFSDIKRLSIQLPCHGDELGSKSGDPFLRWKAEFGRELQGCVIVGAKSIYRSSSSSTPSTTHKNHKQVLLDEPMLATNELKRRVVWMISCLIAASTRHWLLKQIIADCPMNLQSVMISDTSKQGKMTMGEDQLKELRGSTNPRVPVERTMVPEVGVKLWYSPVLELPASGLVMKGATLMVIRPIHRNMTKMENEYEDLGGCFEGAEQNEEGLREAVRKMLKEKKPCMMKIDSI